MKSKKNNLRQIANESNREHNFEICFEIYISILSYLQNNLVALYTCRHISYPMIQPRDDGFGIVTQTVWIKYPWWPHW